MIFIGLHAACSIMTFNIMKKNIKSRNIKYEFHYIQKEREKIKINKFKEKRNKKGKEEDKD
jgi:hypothetical protein